MKQTDLIKYPFQTTAANKKRAVPAHSTYRNDDFYEFGEFIYGTDYLVSGTTEIINEDLDRLVNIVFERIKEAIDNGSINRMRRMNHVKSQLACILGSTYKTSRSAATTLISARGGVANTRIFGWGQRTLQRLAKHMAVVMPEWFELRIGNWHRDPRMRSCTSIIMLNEGLEVFNKLDSLIDEKSNNIKCSVLSDKISSKEREIENYNRQIDDITEYLIANSLDKDETIDIINSIGDIQHKVAVIRSRIRDYNTERELDLLLENENTRRIVGKINTINKLRNKVGSSITVNANGSTLKVSDALTWNLRLNEDVPVEDQHKFLYARAYSDLSTMRERIRLQIDINGESVIGVDMKSSMPNHALMASGKAPMKDYYSQFVSETISRDMAKELNMSASFTKNRAGAIASARIICKENGIDYSTHRDEIISVLDTIISDRSTSSKYNWAVAGTLESLFNIGVHYEFAKLGISITSVHDQWYIPESKFDLFKAIAAKVTKQLYGTLDSDLYMTKSKLVNGEIIEEDFSIDV